MRRFVDGVLGVGDSAFTVTNLASDKVASGLQLLQRRADGVHALLADGGKPAGGVVPLICQREHFGQRDFILLRSRSGLCPALRFAFRFFHVRFLL